MKKRIGDILQDVKKICGNDSAAQVGGSLKKTFPTTVSIVVAEPLDENNVLCEFLWAGDSRGFVLDQDGLCQITLDDIDSNADDAFLNLREDGRLTNIANADVDFDLHCRRIQTKSSMMLISSTDGGFAYFPTPMDFEFVLLNTLQMSETPMQWQERLHSVLKEVAGDDFTISIACFGFSDFNNMKNHYYNRLKLLL